ncbi:hypothetical protein BJF80_10635 [Serinicoccus sp. CUA-874]|nr:hypothetical protein BJF80_10635 [Serinicoccus sp. CUA-874]
MLGGAREDRLADLGVARQQLGRRRLRARGEPSSAGGTAPPGSSGSSVLPSSPAKMLSLIVLPPRVG